MSGLTELKRKADLTRPVLKARSTKTRLPKPPTVSSKKPIRRDKPLSVNQITLSIEFAEFRGFPFPVELLKSNNKWWAWINSKMTQIVKEDAHAVTRDFPKVTVDFNDPTSIIGALIWAAKADGKAKEEKPEDAKRQLLAGTHPNDVKEMFDLTLAELNALVKEVELTHPEFEFDWGAG